MKKQFFSIIGSLLLLTSMPVFANGIGLDLLDGSLSVLDSLFLIAMGVTIIGVVLICIAFLKPEKQKDIPENTEEEFSVFNKITKEAEQKEFSVFDTVDEPKDETAVEEASAEVTIRETAEETVEEISNQEEVAEEEPEESVKEEETAEDTSEEPEEEEPAQKLSLTGINNQEVKIIPLKGEVVIGRKSSCEVVVSDSAISGEHCAIILENEKVYVEDRKSTNGTFVNSERIFDKTEIKKGDILALGHMTFKVGL